MLRNYFTESEFPNLSAFLREKGAENVNKLLKILKLLPLYIYSTTFAILIRVSFTHEMSGNNQVCGQLSKFTNALRGYQYRYFILDPSRGTLEYYLPNDNKRLHPRGFVILSGSIITPSQEDGQTFSVCSSSGEIYKLRAADSRDRQFWVDKLRQVSQNHELIRNNSQNSLEISATSSLEAVRDIVSVSKQDLQRLEASIDNHTVGDHALLTIKALSQASITSMEQCYSILKSTHKVA